MAAKRTKKPWTDAQIAAHRASRPDPGPPPERLTRTKYPFTAIINGLSYTVNSHQISRA